MSDQREAHVEALQVALDTEKKGYKFYKIAAKSSIPKNRKKSRLRLRATLCRSDSKLSGIVSFLLTA